MFPCISCRLHILWVHLLCSHLTLPWDTGKSLSSTAMSMLTIAVPYITACKPPHPLSCPHWLALDQHKHYNWQFVHFTAVCQVQPAYTYIQVASVLQYIRTRTPVHMHAPQCTRFCNCYVYCCTYIQPFKFLISALLMYMGVCMQFGDVYMGRCTAGIGMQS